MAGQLDNELTRVVRSVVEPMGYELVGVQYSRHERGGSVLRVYIDRAGCDRSSGISLEDCGAVSRQLSGVLDVQDPIAEPYSLEVSSPGLDRPLFTAVQYECFRGRRARLRLSTKVQGRRKLEGRIDGLRQGAVLLMVDGETWEIPLETVESARLVPEF